MPVQYTPSGDHHEREEYSFRTRDHGSRNFARSRRFGDDGEEESRPMSLVSTPLQIPHLGKRSVSPIPRRPKSPMPPMHRVNYTYEDEEFQNDVRPMRQRRPCSDSHRGYRYDYEYDEPPLQPLVPTYQPRVRYFESEVPHEQMDRRLPDYYYGQEKRRHPEDVYDESEDRQFLEEQFQEEQAERRRAASKQKRQDDELQSILNWRKRSQEPLVHTDFGYEVPPMRKRVDPLMQEEEENYRSVAGYIAKRRQFAVENDEDMQYYKNPNYQYRIHGMERPLVTEKDVENSMERSKIDRAPMFDMKLRSHVVWEKMKVKFTCTVRGSPSPRVTWYKDMVPLEPSLHSPGKFKISNQFGLHSLEINRAAIEDSGTYRVSLQNRKGEISSYATLLVRRYDGGRIGVVDLKSGYNMRKPSDYPDVEGLNVPDKAPHTSKIEVKEYDELPETDAARQFKSQIDNLDFDVKKLIKEAKFGKELAKIENKQLDNESKLENINTKAFDDAASKLKKGSNDPAHDAALKISSITTIVNGERMGSDYLSGDDGSKGYLSDVSTDNSDHSSQKGRFKVAIEVSVTNENRRDSLDPYEKLIAAEKKNSVDKKDEEAAVVSSEITASSSEPQKLESVNTEVYDDK